METKGNNQLKEIEILANAKLFEDTSPFLIDNTFNLLIKNKSLFLFGTNNSKILNNFSIDNIYIHNIIKRITDELLFNKKIKIYSICLNVSLEKLINKIDKTNDFTNFIIFDNVNLFFSRLSEKELNIELSFINELNNQGIFTIFYLEPFSNQHFFSKMAILLNKTSQFIPKASNLGFMSYLEEKILYHNLILSFECREEMFREISQQFIPLSIINDSIQLLNKIIVKDKISPKIVSRKLFMEIGGFRNLIQKQYEFFLNKFETDRINKVKITHLSTQQILKCFFKSFLIKDHDNNFNIRSLPIEDIKEISMLPNETVKEIIEALEIFPFLFIKNEKEFYTLNSTDFLFYWNEMIHWISEELDNINQYIYYKKLAVSHQNGKADLLTGSSLENALLWHKESNHNLVWAKYYAPEYELTIQYIENSFSEHKTSIDASHRRSNRLLKISRGIAFVVGFAFILSSLAAILAGFERNNAILAKKAAETDRINAIKLKELAEIERNKAFNATKAEHMAKQVAEHEKQQAFFARDLANQEKLKALIARNAEIKAKEQAELERTIAISAKDLAENERKNAISARLEVDKALIQASNNFNRAEKLRKQQESRADALNSFRLLLNNQYNEALKLVTNAYSVNLQNDGNQFEPDIYKSLVYGMNMVKPENFSFKLKQPLKNIAISPNGKIIACYSIGGILSILTSYFYNNISLKIPFQIFKSFSFTQNNDLLVGTTDGFIHLYDPVNGFLKWSKYISKDPINSILFIGEDKYVFNSGKQLFLLKGLLQSSPLISIDLPVESTLNKVIKGETSDIIYASIGETLYYLDINNLYLKNYWKKLINIPNLINSLSFKYYKNIGYLLIGDQKGSIYLFDLNSRSILLNKKIHQSSISSCQLLEVNDYMVLISTGLDHKVNVDYLFKIENNSLISKSAVELDLHTGWVTDLACDVHKGICFSCSEDMSIRKWFLNPKEIHIQAETFLNDKN